MTSSQKAEPGTAPGVLRQAALRVAVLYFLAFAFWNGSFTLLGLLPDGSRLEQVIALPSRSLAVWLGTHLVHLTGPAASWHSADSNDKALNWVLEGLCAALALLGGVAWTAFIRWRARRTMQPIDDWQLHVWMRFLLRLTLAIYLLGYGWMKVFPRQMPPVPLAVLNQTVGQMSLFRLLWTFVGVNPGYEIACGVVEALAGALLLWRRTALAGVLLALVVVTQIVLYNWFFAINQKITSANLLLALLFLLLPDLRSLSRFFFAGRDARPVGGWTPVLEDRAARWALAGFQVLVAFQLLAVSPFEAMKAWQLSSAHVRAATPISGLWRFDRPRREGAFLLPDGGLATGLSVEPGISWLESGDGAMFPTHLKLNAKDGVADVYTDRAGDWGVRYRFSRPDPDHLVLRPEQSVRTPWAGPDAGSPPALNPDPVTLTRVPTPARYRLLEPKRSVVVEWGPAW